jgi:hypothetical protein
LEDAGIEPKDAGIKPKQKVEALKTDRSTRKYFGDFCLYANLVTKKTIGMWNS